MIDNDNNDANKNLDQNHSLNTDNQSSVIGDEAVNPPSNSTINSVHSVTKDTNLDSEQNQNKVKKEGGILSLFITIVVALILVQIVNVFFLQSYRVYGNSMYSTLENDDRLIISKFSKTASKITKNDYTPKRGEIIVFQSPVDPEIQLIKRVIGLPGDRVVVSNGTITIFNKDNPKGFNPDDAPYGEDLPPTSGKTDITVPSDHIFVSGDNREGSNSLDSRNELGTVPIDNIIGTLKVRIWPLDNARFF